MCKLCFGWVDYDLFCFVLTFSWQNTRVKILSEKKKRKGRKKLNTVEGVIVGDHVFQTNSHQSTSSFSLPYPKTKEKQKLIEIKN